jgi:hypothetical protein
MFFLKHDKPPERYRNGELVEMPPLQLTPEGKRPKISRHDESTLRLTYRPILGVKKTED